MSGDKPVHVGRDGVSVYTRLGQWVARARTGEDARRIVAALNAIDGIPTDALERLPGDAEGFVAALPTTERKH